MLPVLALVDPSNQIIDQQQHADGKQENIYTFNSEQSWDMKYQNKVGKNIIKFFSYLLETD